MTLKRALMVLVLTALAALSGCGGNGGTHGHGAAVDPGLGPVTYVVTGVTVDGKPHALVKGTQVRIRFAGGTITLTAGCNTMSGGYTLEENRLTVESLATTAMGCDQARGAQDTWLAGLFAKPVQLTTGTDPTIVAGSTVLAMVDREKLSPELDLIGPTWTLESIVATDANGVTSSVPTGLHVTLFFTTIRMSVFDGCNRGTGSFTIGQGSITFGPRTVSNPKPCPSSGTLEIVQRTLDGSATYTIDDQTLTITRGGHTLSFLATRTVLS